MSDDKEISPPECPRCQSLKLMVERRPNGDASCEDCKWRGAYEDCFVRAFNDISEKQRKLFEFHGMEILETQAAAFAFKAFLENENRRGGGRMFWTSPLGRQAFMLGWKYGRKP